ncbi:MAG: hypothetical protein QE271_14465 [Bacteriovoracaceae bacterium]|nr:hypothetical protein [Bacteriovoracaceae bacterium]
MKKIFYFLFFTLLIFSGLLCSQPAAKKKVVYKYKQYEKFDFENMGVDVNKSGIGDLSIHPRFSTKQKNKLPQKPNMNKELIDSVDFLP